MNLKQLEYFVSVAETLNFTKAAKKCFISQTAMTQQIRADVYKRQVEFLVQCVYFSSGPLFVPASAHPEGYSDTERFFPDEPK